MGDYVQKTGESNTRFYRIWYGIIRRTEHSHRKEYKNYGGRGIKMCPEWRDSFVAFREWALANGYDENLTIERLDNNGDYCPENCCWADKLKQENNKVNTIMLTHNGRTLSISDWAREQGVPYARLKKRVRLGWTPDRVLDLITYKNQYA